MTIPARQAASAGPVLTKAFLRAGERLGLRGSLLAKVVGVSTASLSRLGRSRDIDPSTKEGELALLFVRLFRSLDAMVGGSEEQARLWLEAENLALGGTPAELIQTAQGLVHAVDYLDALRGR